MKSKLSSSGRIIITILRILIGGHLFFQGMIKLVSPTWTSQLYLENSYGIFAWISGQTGLVKFIDFLNIWGLILIGAALVIGMYERIAAICGIVLLGLYYFAYPPFNLMQYNITGEGQSFIVNATLLEIIALIVLFAIPTGKLFGLARLSEYRSNLKSQKEEDGGPGQAKQQQRRELLKSLGTLPFLGVFAVPFMQKKLYENIDAVTGASSIVLRDDYRKEHNRLKNLDLEEDSRVGELRAEMSYGMIGNLKISRLISGSNLISMNMHPRDLDYVVPLARNYNTEDRILMTMKKMEEYGVNSIVLKTHNFHHFNLKRYWTEWGGKMKWIADPITNDIEKFESVLVDHLELGASAAYIWGGSSDQWYFNNEPDNIGRALEIIKSYNIPAGIGAHRTEPIAFAIKENYKPDFFFKTFHRTDYWSAHPEENYDNLDIYKPNSTDHNKFHDNIWCFRPEEVTELMKDSDIPWIAFKTMAAGAIPPKVGFDYAFQNGADFICVGMFDFQVEENMGILKESIKAARQRQRKWIG